jgi:hypothetical protein
MSLNVLRAIYGINVRKIVEVEGRAQAMHDGMEGDPATYANPTLALPAFLGLIQNLGTSQQAVRTRIVGARENRDVNRSLLLSGMGVQRSFIQSLADANPLRAAVIITNGGLIVATTPVRTKGLLTLRNAKASGSVTCDANVGLLVGAGALHPSESRYFNWEYTLDGAKTLVTLPSTTRGKTLIQGLPALATVGVRVSLTNSEGPGPWSQWVTILVL